MAQATAKRTEKDVKKVSAEIEAIYARREAAVFALSLSYSIRAINLFRKNQAGGRYWVNRTSQAMDRVFSNAFRDSKGIGFYLAHGVAYGIYLELANNREHAALKPIISGLTINFVKNIKEIYS